MPVMVLDRLLGTVWSSGIAVLNINLLYSTQVEWLNDYHRQCIDKVAPVLKEQGKEQALLWLLKEASLF